MPLVIPSCTARPWQLVRAFSEDDIALRVRRCTGTVARVGKMDAKKHLDTQLNQLMSANILQCMCAPLLPSCIPTPHSCRHRRVAQCCTGVSFGCLAHAAHVGRHSAQCICSALPAPNHSSLLRKRGELGKIAMQADAVGRLLAVCAFLNGGGTHFNITGLKSL